MAIHLGLILFCKVIQINKAFMLYLTIGIFGKNTYGKSAKKDEKKGK
jgi:hypothetical protein